MEWPREAQDEALFNLKRIDWKIVDQTVVQDGVGKI
jgi:hypothetical protein